MPFHMLTATAAERRHRTRRQVPTLSGAAEAFGDLGIGPLTALPAVLREYGVDAQPLLKRAGVAHDAFEQAQGRVSLQRMTHLLQLCVEATGTPHFAVLVAQRFDIGQLGPLGYVMKNETTVHAALRRLVLDLRLQDRSAVVGIEDLGHRLVGLSYAVCTPDTPYAGLADDAATMIGVRIMQALCGPGWRLTELQLAHAAQGNGRTLQQLFAAPVRFDAPRSMITFEKRWLDRPVPGADPLLRELLEHMLAAGRATPVRMTDQVRRLLSSGLRGGRVDAAHIADLLGLSERSLRRRLAEEGGSLHRLAAEARLIVARQLLEETQLPIDEIAVTLNYSDVTAFTRAFRGWTGTTPGRWRADPTGRLPR